MERQELEKLKKIKELIEQLLEKYDEDKEKKPHYSELFAQFPEGRKCERKMKMKISFWFEEKRYSVIIDTSKINLGEVLECIDRQYKQEEDKQDGSNR